MAETLSRSRRRARVFINYRRADSQGQAGRLYDSLRARFGADQVFMDVDGVRPGADFVQTLETALEQCEVLLALIGPAWLGQADQRGRRRLDDPQDIVRKELETALRRAVVVVPVLVGDAHMPTADQLPGPLGPLARRQALRLSDPSWRRDLRALAAEVDRLLGHDAQGGRRQAPSRSTSESERSARSGDSRRLDLTEQRIDAQAAYNRAALRSRGATVEKIMGVTRDDLASSNKQVNARHRGMDGIRRSLTGASSSAQDALLQAFQLDSAAITEEVASRREALSRLTDDMLNGPGAIAAAPQPLPDLPEASAWPGGGGRPRRRRGGRRAGT